MEVERWQTNTREHRAVRRYEAEFTAWENGKIRGMLWPSELVEEDQRPAAGC